MIQHTRFTYTTYLDYMHGIAEKHKQIKGFVETDLDDLGEVLRSGQDLPAMLVPSFKEVLSDERDNTQSHKECLFGIVNRYSSKARNSKTPRQIIDECRQTALDVLSFLRNEKRNNRLPGLDLSNIGQGEAILNEGDGYYGWQFAPQISTPENLKFNPEKWNL